MSTETLIKILEILIPVVIGLIGIWKLVLKSYFESLKSKNDALLILTVKLDELITGLNKINTPIIIENDNSAAILKDAIFTKFCSTWVRGMECIYDENGILTNKDEVLAKIESCTNSLLKATFEKSVTINGVINYLPAIEKVYKVLKDEDVFEKVYDYMKRCKTDNDEFKLHKNLNALYNIIYSKIDGTFC